MSSVPAVQSVPSQAIQAAQRGDLKGLIEAFNGDASAIASYALELRRQNVATLGNHEAFVRHTPEGTLEQVIRPVVLSLGDKTLYQIPQWNRETRSMEVRDKSQAALTYSGYNALNAVAGCAVGQPPVVVVDGVERTNPYVERVERADGRLGDIRRIVFGVVVVGPAPATGNPVVVNYTLDYDPLKDLASMLDGVARQNAADCYLLPEDLVPAKPEGRWHFLPVAAGVGYYHNLANDKVRDAYGKYIEIQGNAVRKAQTVARRNAMKSHPALGLQTVRVDQNGVARVAVLGWAGDARALRRWQEINEALSKGLDLPSDANVGVIREEGVYDVEHSEPEPEQAPELDPATVERNQLIDYIDQGVLLLSPQQATRFDFRPDGATLEELRAKRAELDRLVGGGA